MIKRTDLAVAGLVIDFAEGNLKGGETVTLGLKDEGVGLSPLKYTKKEIPAEVLDRVDQARADIIDGKIKVWNVIDQGYPSFYKP
jgi:basic membrane protein A